MANNLKLSYSETDNQNSTTTTNSSSSSSRSKNLKDDICRDFLRNVCHRGSGCKYRHPEQTEAKSLGKTESVEFCHDYQNGQCMRRNCKFIHCSKDEEEFFRSSGRLSNQTPICKDFLNGKCRRSTRCKFQHVAPTAPAQRELPYENDVPHQYNRYDDGLEPHVKRRALNMDYMDHYNSYVERPQAMPEYYVRLEEENRMLSNKVDQLQKQVADLTSTNEFLLDQNAKLRVTKQSLVSNVHSTANWSSDPKQIDNGIDPQGVYTW